MSEEQAAEEKVDQASEEEKPEESPSKAGGVKGALNRYKEAQAEKSAEKPDEKPEDKEKEEEPCPTCGDDDDKETEADDKQEAKLWIVDKEGNRTPFVFKADGKVYTPDKPDWAIQQTSLGVHSNVKTEEANKNLQEYEQIKPFFDFLSKAIDDGRVMVDGKKISPAEKDFGAGKETEPEDEEEDEELLDPEVKKLREQLKKNEEELKKLKDHELKKMITQARTELENQISEHSKSFYAAYTRLEGDPEDGVMPLRVWDLLSKHKDMDVEEAMRRSHDSMENFVDHLIENNPKFLEKHRKKIITDYLKKKEEDEKAPVGAPSGLPAGTPVKKEGKDKVKGVRARIQLYQQLVKEREAAGRKS